MNDLRDEIRSLKEQYGAIILAHNYQLPEIQDIADFTGDSLALARKATEIDQDVIVFCGVYFMAETAAILNPQKTVIIPDPTAGCPLADFASGETVREWKQKYPDHAFVAYINSNADVKAEVDICCTSSNAVKIVNSLEQDKIVFLPDRNLGSYVAEQTDKEIVLWNGYCVVHETVNPKSIIAVQERYPDAITMAHPECPKPVREIADEICSTGQMFGVVDKYPDVKRFIVVTEWGMNYALQERYLDKEFIEPERRMECKNMKKITAEKLKTALADFKKMDYFTVKADPEIGLNAKKSIDRMLAIK